MSFGNSLSLGAGTSLFSQRVRLREAVVRSSAPFLTPPFVPHMLGVVPPEQSIEPSERSRCAAC